MIRGLGIDLCDIAEMRQRMNDVASAFATTHFTPRELAAIRTRPSGDPAQHAAARYAAKEACLKALSIAANGTQQITQPNYRDIEVLNEASGAPHIVLHGAMQRLAQELGIQQLCVSLTHEAELAAAVVVLT